MRLTFEEAFQPVDHASSIPLYLQIVLQIDSALRKGRLTQDALLPSENELCAGFGVARSTLRRAMGKLEDRGTVSRERGRGRGTRIVGPAQVTRTPGGFATIFDAISASARKPRTVVLAFEEMIVDEEFSEQSGLPVGMELVHILRHRSANEEPIAVIENWIRRDLVRFEPQRLEGESLERLLREGGVRLHHAEFEFRAVLAEGGIAAFFDVHAGVPVIQEERRIFDEHEQYEYAHNYSHPHNARLRGVASP